MKFHNWYYFFLFLIFLAGSIAISILRYNKLFQIGILVILAAGYVVLGIIHHSTHHTITAKIVIEYLAIATLGISVTIFVLQGM